MTLTFILNTAGVIVLALVHVFGKQLLFKKEISRIAWLSFAGGASVSYVFVYILPELADDDVILKEYFGITFLEHHVYLVSLLGLIIFYGLEKAFRLTRKGKFPTSEKNFSVEKLFWYYILIFGIYNALIGYLLVNREDPGIIGLLFYTIAMGFHFLVNDSSLSDHFKKLYDVKGRKMLALAVIAGWLIGNMVHIHEAGLAVLRAFISGGIILTVLKEELPEENRSRFWAFAAGAVIYTVLLLTID